MDIRVFAKRVGQVEPCWRTGDGMVWDNKEDAEKHVKVCSLAESIIDSAMPGFYKEGGSLSYNTGVEALAFAIVEKRSKIAELLAAYE